MHDERTKQFASYSRSYTSVRSDFDKLLAEETRLPVRIAEDPLTCVVHGGGRLLDQRGQPDLVAMTVS